MCTNVFLGKHCKQNRAKETNTKKEEVEENRQKKRRKSRRGKAAQHVLQGLEAGLPLNFIFITKISIFVLSVFHGAFLTQVRNDGKHFFAPHTGNWLLFMIAATTRTIRRTNALHTWESVSFRLVIETIEQISKTEQKADRYNKCNICPIETLHSKEAGGGGLHNAYAMRCLGTLREHSQVGELFNNWRHAYETRLGISSVFPAQKIIFFLVKEWKQSMSLWNSILAGYFCTHYLRYLLPSRTVAWFDPVYTLS